MGDQNLSFEEVLSDPEYSFDRVARRVEEEIMRLDDMLRSASEATNNFFESKSPFESGAEVEEIKAQLQNIDFQYSRLKTLLEAKKAVVHLSAASDEHLMKVELANALRVAAESKADKDIANADARYAVEVAKANAEREAVIKKAEADKRAVAAEHAAKVLKAKLEANKLFVTQLDLAIDSLKAVADKSLAGTLFEKLSSSVAEIEKVARQPEARPAPPAAGEPEEHAEPVAAPEIASRDGVSAAEQRLFDLQEELAERRKTEEAYQQALEDLLKAEERIASLEGTKEQLRVEIDERHKIEEQHKEILEYVLKAEERIGRLEEINEQLQSEIDERHRAQEQHKEVLENLLKAEERIAEIQAANEQLQREVAERQNAQERHREVLENLLMAEERIAELHEANTKLQRDIAERQRAEEAYPKPSAIEYQEAPEPEPTEPREEWFPKYEGEEPPEQAVAEPPEQPAEELQETPVFEPPEQPEVWFPRYEPSEHIELSCSFCSAPGPEFREGIASYYCSVCGYVWRP